MTIGDLLATAWVWGDDAHSPLTVFARSEKIWGSDHYQGLLREIEDFMASEGMSQPVLASEVGELVKLRNFVLTAPRVISLSNVEVNENGSFARFIPQPFKYEVYHGT